MFIIKIVNLTLLIDGGSSCNSSSGDTSSRFLKVLWAGLLAVGVLLSAAVSALLLFSGACSVEVLPYLLRWGMRRCSRRHEESNFCGGRDFRRLEVTWFVADTC